MTTNSEAAIFSRVLEAENPTLSADAAKSILALDFTAADRDRMNALSAKAREGTLTAEENEELENFVRVGDLLAIMQSKARRSMQNGVSLPPSDAEGA
jgi:hypothetical protein